MTPPPSYASLFKDAGAPAPRPAQGSRAAVWPSRHPSPVWLGPTSVPIPRHPESAAAASLRSLEQQVLEEARRPQQRHRLRGYPQDHDTYSSQRTMSSSAQSSSRPRMVLHGFSYSFVQESVIRRVPHDRDPSTNPDEGWLPVRERLDPGLTRRSGVKGQPYRTSRRPGVSLWESSGMLRVEMAHHARQVRQPEVQRQTIGVTKQPQPQHPGNVSRGGPRQ